MKRGGFRGGLACVFCFNVWSFLIAAVLHHRHLCSAGGRHFDLSSVENVVAVREGDELERRCQLYDGSRWSRCVWKHGGRYMEILRGEDGRNTVHPYGDDRVRCDASFTDCTLRIRDVSRAKDSGAWTCKLAKRGGRWRELNLFVLDVYRPCEVKLEAIGNPRYKFVVGETYRIRCSAVGGDPEVASLAAFVVRGPLRTVRKVEAARDVNSLSFDLTPNARDVDEPIVVVCSASQGKPTNESAVLKVSNLLHAPRLLRPLPEGGFCGSAVVDVELSSNPTPEVFVVSGSSSSGYRVDLPHRQLGNRLSVRVPTDLLGPGSVLRIANEAGSIEVPMTCPDRASAAVRSDRGDAVKGAKFRPLHVAVFSFLLVGLVLAAAAAGFCFVKRRKSARWIKCRAGAAAYSDGSSTDVNDVVVRGTDVIARGIDVGAGETEDDDASHHLYEKIDEEMKTDAFTSQSSYAFNPFKLGTLAKSSPGLDVEPWTDLDAPTEISRKNLSQGNMYETLEFARPNKPLDPNYHSSKSLSCLGENVT